MMKKSEALHLAQIAVIDCEDLTTEAKTEILWYLMDEERLAVFCENREEAVEE